MIRAPTIISRLFEKFPLIQYESLKIKPPIDTTRHQLFVAYGPNTPQGTPSHDLESLRWQTFLLLTGIPHTVIPASPYASPSGTLPFFIVASNYSQNIVKTNTPSAEKNDMYDLEKEDLGNETLSFEKKKKDLKDTCSTNSSSNTDTLIYTLPSTEGRLWLERQGIELHPFACHTELAADADSYLSLIENALYDAWLYTCFIEHENFQTVTSLLYITAVWPLREILKWQLCKHIKRHLSDRQKTGLLNAREIYADAYHALSALSTRLGQDEWFFGAKSPTFIDATLFSYTYLVLSIQLPNNTLMNSLKKYTNLVNHATRLWEYCYV
ncbi:hypothetical protein PORY_002815 [Pneumocystis oryctolagi]|uniref:Uncharacterized protein n=1 Tax=Pneumocystis oryctolagi TaxID=42067 RepID=A0ACB7C9V8_9ASCO|nr:hypothetical protein PORY_002815 [Pneumocystis oryctolagi]